MTAPGTIRGAIRISATQALAAYASVRRANAATRASLLGASAAFTRVGLMAGAAAAPIALLFKSAISNAATFAKKIDYYGAVTNASGKEMDELAQKAISMSKTTVFSASDMADAFVEFGKAGVSAKDILNGVADATANLAQAADISMGEASNIMASTMATFQIKAGGAAHVADELAGAANASIIDVQDLAYSLKYAGGIAATTGVPFNDLVTAISLLGQRGIKGSTAGTSLRQIMVSLTGSTKAASAALDQLGLLSKDGTTAFVNSAGKLKPLAQVFQILQNAEKGYTDAQKLAINKQIFNSRALSSVMILMRDGAKGFSQMQAQIGKVKAADVAGKRLDNLSGDVQHLKNSWQTLMIQVGLPLQNFFRKIVQALTFVVQWFTSLSTTTQKFIIYGLGVVGVLLTIVSILTLTAAAVLKFIAIWKEMRELLILIRAWVLLTSTAFRALAVSMMTNPVFLIIAAIIALVAIFIYCWKHFAGFRNFFKKAWADIKGFFIGAWDVIKAVFNWIVSAAKTVATIYYNVWVRPIIIAVKAVISAFKTVYNAIVTAVMAVVHWLEANWKKIVIVILAPLLLLIGLVATIWEKIKAPIMAAVQWIINFVRNHWRLLISIVGGPLGILIALVTKYWTQIKNVVMAAGHALASGLRAVWNGIKSVALAVWHAIVGAIRAIIDPFIKWFRAHWEQAKQLFKMEMNAIKNVASSIWRAIRAVIMPIVNGIKSGITTAFRAIQSVANTVWHAISAVIRTVFNSTIRPVGNGIKTVFAGIRSALSTLRNAWSTLWHALGAALRAVYNATLKPVLDAIKSILGTIGNVISQVAGAVSKLKGAVGGAIHGAGSLIGKGAGMIGLATGGWVPAAKNRLAENVRVHGGEYVLSDDMLNGRQRIDPSVLAAITAGQNASVRMATRSAVGAVGNMNGNASGKVDARQYTFATYNPVAEKASDSVARRVRTMASLGAFGGND